MSGLCAVVPVKELAFAKRRLAGVLADAVRRELVLAMLDDVLAALVEVRALAGIVVVTADEAVARIAARRGAAAWDEAARDGHSEAIAAAARRLAREGQGMLTLPADVPLVTPGDVERIVTVGGGEPRFVIVPARDGRGSNAVLCAPSAAVPLRFGEDSFAPHLAAAAARGITPLTLHLPRIGLDLDGPDDLATFLRIPSRTRARAVLERNGVTAPAAG